MTPRIRMAPALAGAAGMAVRGAGPSGSLSGLSLGTRAGRQAAASGGGVTYVFEGCVIGADVERWVNDKVASGAGKVMDKAYARNRRQEAR